MSRLWPIARREYLERVRSRAFVIGTVAGPLLIGGMMLVPTLMTARQRGEPLRLAIVDASGSLLAPVRAALAAARAEGSPRFRLSPLPGGDAGQVAKQLQDAILAGDLDGYLYLPRDILASSAAEYHGRNVSNMMDLDLLKQAVEETLVYERLAGEGLGPEKAKALTHPLDLKTLRVSATGEREDRGASLVFSLLLLMMLYVAVLMWGQALMTGVIEEKTSRVVEVIVSSVPSTRLLTGKLLGVGAAGLTQLGVWVVAMAMLGGYAAGRRELGGMRPPEMTPLLAAAFVVFFLLGFFLYASLYAALGASVNSVQEAQGLAFPIVIPIVLSVMFFGPVLESPDSAFSTTLSLIPFFTPLLMFLRITVLTPPAWQIALSIALTALTIAAVSWGAARIYRVGILMYGKRPTLPEIVRWIGRP